MREGRLPRHRIGTYIDTYNGPSLIQERRKLAETIQKPSRELLVHFVMNMQALLPRHISSFESEKSITIINFLRLRPAHKPSYGLVRMIVSTTATVYRMIPSKLAFFVDMHPERTPRGHQRVHSSLSFASYMKGSSTSFIARSPHNILLLREQRDPAKAPRTSLEQS